MTAKLSIPPHNLAFIRHWHWKANERHRSNNTTGCSKWPSSSGSPLLMDCVACTPASWLRPVANCRKKTTFLVTFPVSASFCSSIWQCAPCRLGTKSHNTSQRRHLGILGFLHVFQKIQCGNRVWHQPCHWILEAARWQDVVRLWCKGDLESLLVSSGNPWPSMSWFQWFQIIVGSRRGWSTS